MKMKTRSEYVGNLKNMIRETHKRNTAVLARFPFISRFFNYFFHFSLFQKKRGRFTRPTDTKAQSPKLGPPYPYDPTKMNIIVKKRKLLLKTREFTFLLKVIDFFLLI